ncbi:putative quinol monooxygenase [Pseudonocardia sp. CA-142604]|uniref:putative quinol monooxygenase n=1 Tax=Pseudonocardia sp. CA-142604 TaxID=3240024 RepID=UPI003D93368A
MRKPFAMHVTLSIRPECREEYREALDKVIDQARALPECRYLYVYETVDDPDTIQLVESWSDWDTFQNEVLGLDFYREYAAASESMYAGPRKVVLLTPLHGSEWR